MKLTVSIPVEKIQVAGGYTFRAAIVEAEIVRILRSPSGRDRLTGKPRGWYYSADVEHPDIAPEASLHPVDGTYRASISRTLNPKWKPPQFPAGASWVSAAASPG